MKKDIALIFFLLAVLSFHYSNAQVTIAQQDFDGGTPIMTYTGGSTTSAIGPFPNTPNYVSGSHALEVNNDSQIVEFASVNASSYTSISFSVRLASFAGTSGNGAEASDNVIISVSTDGGTTYSEELQVNGNSNAKWGFSGTNAGTGNATTSYDGDNSTSVFAPGSGGYATTDGYSYLSISGLPSSSLLRLKVELTNNSANETWVIDDALIKGISSAPCTTPTAQPAALNFSNITNSSFNGSFSASSPTAENYLVVYSTSATLGANPIDTTSYTNGDTIASGTVLQSSNATTFSLTGLNPTTVYYIFIFSYNSSCSGGPLYNTTLPLTNNETTSSGPCLEESFTSTTFAPTGWLASNAIRSTVAANYNSAPAAVTFSANNGYLTTDVISNPSSLSFYLGRSGNTNAKTFNINVSTTSQTGPFTTVTVFDHSNVPSASYNQYTVDLSAYSANTNVWIQFEKVSTTNSPWRFDDVSVNCSSPSCTPTQTITSFTPTTGPELSHITITGTGFTAGSTVDFNGTAATITSQTATQIIAEAPIGVTTGVITVTEAGCPLDSSTDFTLINGSCSGGGGIPTGFTDLMFSGIYDETLGSCHYIQLLNPTASNIDLSGYSIGFSNNQTNANTLPTTYNGGTYPLSGIIAAGDTFLILTTSQASNCASCTNVTLDDQFLLSALGYNGFTTANYDKLVLLNGVTAIDLWSNGDGHDDGYIYTRANTATTPALAYNPTDWLSSTITDCFDFEITPFPTIDVQPLDIDNCDAANVNVSVTAGGGGTLSYQWKYNNGTSGWLDVTSAAFNTGTVTGETTTDLSISGYNLDGYQFYCEVTESGVCSIATNATQVSMANTVWNGTAWSNGLPTLTKMAIIDGSYNTSAEGSFQACSLIINSSGITPEYRLTVANNTFVEVENNVLVDGELHVETQGAFVQNSNTSLFNLTSNGTALVNKMTTPLNSIYEYTYWSSPINNLMIQDCLATAHPWRRYWFNAANFLDEFIEIDNTNTFISGSDGIDDNGDDWTQCLDTDLMISGLGYTAMHNPVGFVSGTQYTYTFEGEFNNGIIDVPIFYNGANGDEDWNLIGNPYPSAIDTNTFLADNSAITGGAIYLWSQNTPVNGDTSGNQGANFSQGDYAIITNGSGNTAGGDMIIPNNFVPSGQSFFIQGLANGNATFNNSHRKADVTSNSQFFKNNLVSPNRLWVNLTSDNGVFNQILVAYVDGATNATDNTSYDVKASIYNINAAVMYTEIENNSERFTIQGKAPESLVIDEVIPVGFETTITVPTIYTLSIAQFEGLFFENNTVYLKDNLLNIDHNLSTLDYTFTSEAGNFNSRFEIVFQINTLTTNGFELNSNNISIVELQNNNVKFTLASKNLSINSVEILDTLGRSVYKFRGSENTEIYNLGNISSSIYIAQIELSNGSVITKKAVKK
ncbi:hypothetical protein [Lacinutrix sp.]|uniref:hypothetical protein n=1 Tax=Lacinutrix sp. TaxID=1937692 RepID=UPI0025BD608A|nr:hypothetical protein [Lacinutrix sp.]